MKRLIVLMMLLALWVACIAGCGGKNETSTTGSSESTGETTAATNGTDEFTGTAEGQTDETLSQEDLTTLPEGGDVNDLPPEIDIDLDVDDDPVENTTKSTTGGSNEGSGNAGGTTEAETTQPTQGGNTDEPTEPTQSTTKPPKDYTDKTGEDDFAIDFDDLIGGKNP